MSKDLFSSAALNYSKYRPTYPPELYDFILSFVPNRALCWDAATGNGQAAYELSKYFDKVIATDISTSQLEHAVKRENIEYRCFPSEATDLENNSVDLITVATAYHWFNHKEFENEAKRVGKENSLIAVWAYNLLRTENAGLNSLVDDFYDRVTKPYWEKERKHVDNSYSEVYFPFEEIPSPPFQVIRHWNVEDLIGFFSTWSAVQTYIRKNGTSPLPALKERLSSVWPSKEMVEVTFPLFIRLGRLRK